MDLSLYPDPHQKHQMYMGKNINSLAKVIKISMSNSRRIKIHPPTKGSACSMFSITYYWLKVFLQRGQQIFSNYLRQAISNHSDTFDIN